MALAPTGTPVPTPTPTPSPAPTPAPAADPAPAPAGDSILGDAPPASDSILGDPPEGAAPPAAAPVEYGEFELPDGFELDAEALPAVKEVFNELGLNQDGAQRLISLFAENSSNLLEAVEQQAADEWQELRSDWTKVIETDPDIGGAKLPGVRASISKLFDRFGTPGLRDALKLTGADNNPEIVKTFAKMASVLSEGKYIAGSDPKPPPKTAAQALYPDGPNTGIMGQTS